MKNLGEIAYNLEIYPCRSRRLLLIFKYLRREIRMLSWFMEKMIISLIRDTIIFKSRLAETILDLNKVM